MPPEEVELDGRAEVLVVELEGEGPSEEVLLKGCGGLEVDAVVRWADVEGVERLKTTGRLRKTGG